MTKRFQGSGINWLIEPAQVFAVPEPPTNYPNKNSE